MDISSNKRLSFPCSKISVPASFTPADSNKHRPKHLKKLYKLNMNRLFSFHYSLTNTAPLYSIYSVLLLYRIYTVLSIAKWSRSDVEYLYKYKYSIDSIPNSYRDLESVALSVCRGPGSHPGGMMEKVVSVLPPLRLLWSFQGHALWGQLHSLYSMKLNERLKPQSI